MISIVMPAYNVEKYIAEAIDSIIVQTYKDWELIVVDDCSKDATCEIVEQYVNQYSNIKLIRRKENSGNPRIPRFEGVLAAKGEFVCAIDSDDFIAADYLQQCVIRQTQTDVDIVSTKLVFCDEDACEREYVVPNMIFDYSKILSGYEAVKLTIGGWQISVNGLLIKRDKFVEFIEQQNLQTYQNCAFIDEMDYRQMLLKEDKIAFCDANYYYRQQDGSVVHDVSAKYFRVLDKEMALFNLVEQNYKDDKVVYNKACNNYLSQLLICQRLFVERKQNYIKEERSEIKGRIKVAFEFAKAKRMVIIGMKQKVSLLSYPIFVLISYLYVFYLSLK